MKALLTLDNGETLMIDVWRNHPGPIFADTIADEIRGGWNSDKQHLHKVVKVKVFRTGDIIIPDEVKKQLPKDFLAPKPKIGDNINRSDFTPSRSRKKRTLRIW